MDQDEFEDIDSHGQWQNLYNEIRNQSQECSYKVAKFPENRNRNRYRDVSPYDHSRVRLENLENDYINASLITMEEAQRNYILTQGPLINTRGHFWLMIWEQRSKAVIMLNRVIEKGSEKCAQYWPSEEEKQMYFSDTGFVVTLVSEDVEPYYTTRVLELQNIKTGERRDIYHFHFTTWPDFGVPESPASFLNFLFKVRESGSLEPENGPAVVHCSAGIGRSGTFSLVDTCLVLMDKRKDASSVDVQKVLLDMREYRMGLIQTPNQLRFSYMAIMEGAKCILGDSILKQWQKMKMSKEDMEPQTDLGPAVQDTAKQPDELIALISNLREEEDQTVLVKEEQQTDLKPESLRKRHREERKASTAQKVQQMKQKLSEAEKKRESWLYWRPILFNVGAGTALALGLFMCWAFLSQ
ncbi:tyrosine-protein phosphatase non-receptor type 2a isoform X2 [Pangasianodon hypophthalmus]|uniref:tyrosine-protein phosphatase non-receptor type 2a isoform X2 n=1 Tax=Pangasianodon hypophthalmus TaxID=310915 RepID=UPI00147CACF3|nr:tyrosine-protein phosphatase non-receptor type 2a isoform X2 [Pangasianodon hypophthalmus]